MVFNWQRFNILRADGDEKNMEKLMKIENSTIYHISSGGIPVGDLAPFNLGDMVMTSSGPFIFDGLKWQKVESGQNIEVPNKWTIFVQTLRALKFHLRDSWDYLKGKHVCDFNDYD